MYSEFDIPRVGYVSTAVTRWAFQTDSIRFPGIWEIPRYRRGNFFKFKEYCKRFSNVKQMFPQYMRNFTTLRREFFQLYGVLQKFYKHTAYVPRYMRNSTTQSRGFFNFTGYDKSKFYKHTAHVPRYMRNSTTPPRETFHFYGVLKIHQHYLWIKWKLQQKTERTWKFWEKP